MARKSDKDQIQEWNRKIGASEKCYKKWSEKFNIDLALDYYQGFQWSGSSSTNSNGQEKYVINLYYPAIETKRPSLMFYNPQYSVKARPSRDTDPASEAEGRAQLREDVLNTFVNDHNLDFRDKTGLALFEALFTYGIVEVGYSANFADNPYAGKPIYDEDGEDTGEVIPENLPESERLFIKRIPSKCFRVSANEKNCLVEHDWVGYYEWQYPDDVIKNPNYSNTAYLKRGGAIKPDYSASGFIGDTTKDKDEDAKHRDMVKIWKIWDIRRKKRFTFGEGSDGYLETKDFKFLPFACLKFKELLDQWYPMPITFNWKHPQDELNETRDQQRKHRQRFNRKFLHTPAITDEEASKLVNGDDGTVVEAASVDCVAPVPDAPLDSAVARNIPQTKDDFNEISGVTAEQRGIAESVTATQSNILDTRSRVRESMERVEVAQWLSEIGRLMLKTIEANMALPIWVQTQVDPTSPAAPQLSLNIAKQWQQIMAEDMGNIDYDISVDIENLSPTTEMQQRQDWNTFMATVMSQPLLIQVFAVSPALLRKTAKINGIKAEKDLMELERVIPLLAAGMMQAQQGGGPGQAGATPGQGDIMAQLQAQMPQGVQ